MEESAKRSPAPPLEVAQEKDLEVVQELAKARQKIITEIGKVIVGQENVIDHLLISLFSQGHSLFVGVPGLAKTLLVSTLAQVLNLKFNRIQFTPDLMPSDITGTDILQEDPISHQRTFTFMKGPIFCNLLLADEINRTPPKTQAALLQAMQEHRVTVGGKDFHLDEPFLVFATQNPIEHEGTYPLPEAQLDRFLFHIDVHYPNMDQEVQIAEQTTRGDLQGLEKVLSPEEIVSLQQLVRRVPAAPHIIEYAVRLVRMTRPPSQESGDSPEFVKKYVAWGAGPRASQSLVLAGKARAILNGRYAVTCSDIRALAHPVLQHRVLTNFHAEADGVQPTQIINQVLEENPEV
jgi:MoxR-like ATPase